MLLNLCNYVITACLYYGVYGDLNGKKYRLCYWLTLQAIDDVKELFKIVFGETIDDSEANKRFLKCGGAMGDLVLENGIQMPWILGALLFEPLYPCLSQNMITKTFLGSFRK